MHDVEIQKKQIKRCFNKAVRNYEQAAVVQKIAGEHLLSKLALTPHISIPALSSCHSHEGGNPLLPVHHTKAVDGFRTVSAAKFASSLNSTNFRNDKESESVGNKCTSQLFNKRDTPQIILDLGSGTGYSTRMLAEYYPDAEITGIDLAENMVHYANHIKTAAQYLCADFDVLPFSDDIVDLIFSNMALQWSLDFSVTLSEWHRTLRPKGLLLLSVLSKNSLHELRTCLNNNACHINSFLTPDEIINKLVSNGFAIREHEVKTHQLFYDDFSSILHSIKNVGANHVIRANHQYLLTKKSFLTAENHYQQYAIAGKLPITYELCYIMAEAKK